jgi:hypothetical protein
LTGDIDPAAKRTDLEKQLGDDAAAAKAGTADWGPFIHDLGKDLKSTYFAANQDELKAAAQEDLKDTPFGDLQIVGVRENGTIVGKDASGTKFTLNADGTKQAYEAGGKVIAPDGKLEQPPASGSQRSLHEQWVEARKQARLDSAADVNNDDKHTFKFGDTTWDIASASAKKHSGHDPNNTEITNEVIRVAKKNPQAFGDLTGKSDDEVMAAAGKITAKMINDKVSIDTSPDDPPQPVASATEQTRAQAADQSLPAAPPADQSRPPGTTSSDQSTQVVKGDGQTIYYDASDTAHAKPTGVDYPTGTHVKFYRDDTGVITGVDVTGDKSVNGGQPYTIVMQQDNKTYEERANNNTLIDPTLTYTNIAVDKNDGTLTLTGQKDGRDYTRTFKPNGSIVEPDVPPPPPPPSDVAVPGESGQTTIYYSPSDTAHAAPTEVDYPKTGEDSEGMKAKFTRNDSGAITRVDVTGDKSVNGGQAYAIVREDDSYYTENLDGSKVDNYYYDNVAVDPKDGTLALTARGPTSEYNKTFQPNGKIGKDIKGNNGQVVHLDPNDTDPLNVIGIDYPNKMNVTVTTKDGHPDTVDVKDDPNTGGTEYRLQRSADGSSYERLELDASGKPVQSPMAYSNVAIGMDGTIVMTGMNDAKGHVTTIGADGNTTKIVWNTDHYDWSFNDKIDPDRIVNKDGIVFDPKTGSATLCGKYKGRDTVWVVGPGGTWQQD